MRQTIKLFGIGLRQIARDGMLLVLLPSPLLVGITFKFAIPFADGILPDKLSFSLLPWYGLVDGMLICLTPMFTAMVSAFLMLEERDDGISAFYQITPAGGYSYLAARICIPSIWAFATTVIVVWWLNISGLPTAVIWTCSLISTLEGIALFMMLVSTAGNRVEGLALSKLMGVSLLGLPLVWFAPAPHSYFLAFMPSFWIGKIIIDGSTVFSATSGLLSCLIWIALFIKKFMLRIQ